MDRRPGLSVRWKLTLSYAAFVVLVGLLLIAVVWVFLLRYVPSHALRLPSPVPTRPGDGPRGLPSLFIPGRGDLWRAFAPKAAVSLGGLLVVGLVGGWVLAGRMLAPLGRISEAARRAGDGSLSHRVALPGPHDELRELADTFDGMLERLEAQVAEQQRFAANASHELRTPLTILRALIDVARMDPDLDVPALLDRLHAATVRATDLTEALLLLSRADQGAFEPEEVELSLAAEDAAETLYALARRRGVAIDVVASPAPVRGSVALLHQVAINLVHNAIVHNLPAGGHVRVQTQATPTVGELVVENTGDDLDPVQVARLTEPFQRGVERTHTDDAGVGLGLAIVASIVRAHEGTLDLTARSDGGLKVTVRLPRRWANAE